MIPPRMTGCFRNLQYFLGVRFHLTPSRWPGLTLQQVVGIMSLRGVFYMLTDTYG